MCYGLHKYQFVRLTYCVTPPAPALRATAAIALTNRSVLTVLRFQSTNGSRIDGGK